MEIFSDHTSDPMERGVGSSFNALRRQSVWIAWEQNRLLDVIEVSDLLHEAIDPGEVAVISPYADQVDRIEDELNGTPENLEIDTIDGFQGCEKEVVTVPLIRSNPEDEIGFLANGPSST